MSWRTPSPTGSSAASYPGHAANHHDLDNRLRSVRACRLLTRCLDLCWTVDFVRVGKGVEVLQACESLAGRRDRVAGGGEDLADVSDPPVDRHRRDREERRDGDLR